MLCVASGAFLLSLATHDFTLDWQHSVERTAWWERWQVTDTGLAPVAARITASGAGMEPPLDAVLRDGAWEYTPQVPPQRDVWLGASGATGGGWRLCAEGQCHALPEGDGPLHLWSAPDCRQPSGDPQADQEGQRADAGDAGQPDPHEPRKPPQPLTHQ